MRNKPTRAEAMALWHSLDKPSGPKVAARFTAAGRPIDQRTITRWKREGWGVSAAQARRPTPAEARAMWESLEHPTFHKVADAFKAQGRPVAHGTIWNWKKAGWSDINPANVVTRTSRVIEKIAAAFPALTGDPMSTLSDFLPGSDAPGNTRPNDKRRKSEVAEDALLGTMRTATAINDVIYDMAVAVKTDAPADAPPPMLLRQAAGIASLMTASSEGVGVAVGGMRQLPALRAEEEVRSLDERSDIRGRT